MAQTTCTATEDCDKPAAPRGKWCGMHTARWYRHGSFDLPDKKFSYIDKRQGYRNMPITGEREHRYVLRAVIGPEPHPCHWCNKMLTWGVDLVVDHLDWNRLNNDPHNLVPSCAPCNSARPQVHPNTAKTHCKRGHEFTAENTLSNGKGGRKCKTCKRDDGREAARLKRAAIKAANPPQPRERATHCKRGHPFDEANTYLTAEGWRQCRTCRAAWARETSARKKAA